MSKAADSAESGGLDPREIFFWADSEYDGRPRPAEHVRADIDPARRAALVALLRGGEHITSWRGFAECRMGCRDQQGGHALALGHSDLGNHGFMWPSGCEHYLEVHNVWPPGADELLAAAGIVAPPPQAPPAAVPMDAASVAARIKDAIAAAKAIGLDQPHLTLNFDDEQLVRDVAALLGGRVDEIAANRTELRAWIGEDATLFGPMAPLAPKPATPRDVQ